MGRNQSRDVTKTMWDTYRRDQESGHMNMMGHQYAMDIIPQWDILTEWFITQGEEADFNDDARKLMEERVVRTRKMELRKNLRNQLAQLDAELGEEE